MDNYGLYWLCSSNNNGDIHGYAGGMGYMIYQQQCDFGFARVCPKNLVYRPNGNLKKENTEYPRNTQIHGGLPWRQSHPI